MSSVDSNVEHLDTCDTLVSIFVSADLSSTYLIKVDKLCDVIMVAEWTCAVQIPSFLSTACDGSFKL